MRIMISGGGTGGHTSPALAIVQELRRRDPRLLVQWIGRRGAIEERVAATNGIPFRPVAVEGWPRSRSLRRGWAALKLGYGILRAYLYLRKFRPQVVVGVGGYVSLPALWAAQRMGIPTVLHEQNKRLGMANRLLAPKATRLFLSYEETLGNYPKECAKVSGNPVRSGFAHPPERIEARRALGLDDAVPVVLVSGGSQGARSINTAMRAVVGQFAREEAQFLWMTGQAYFEAAREAARQAKARIQVYPFIEDMVTACAAADLIAGRAGASSTAEIAMLGKPSLLIPFPFAADNHQEENARAFESAGACQVLDDSACDGETLAALLRSLLSEPERLDAMGRAAMTLARPLAAETIAEEIMMLVFGTGEEKRNES